MKRTLAGLGLAVGMVIGLGGPAFAGEYNGKYEPVPGGVKGKSECSWSGLDAPDSMENNPPGFDDDALMVHGTQNYGQFVAQGMRDFMPSPGVACNPTRT